MCCARDYFLSLDEIFYDHLLNESELYKKKKKNNSARRHSLFKLALSNVSKVGMQRNSFSTPVGKEITLFAFSFLSNVVI